MGDKKKKKSGLFLSCWLLAILVIVIIFLVKQDEILANLKQTNFFERVFGSTPEFVQNLETKPAPEKETTPFEIIVKPGKETETRTDNPVIEKKDPEQEKPAAVTVSPSEEKPKPAEQTKNVQETVKTETPAEKAAEKPAPVQTSTAKLYFIYIDGNGKISRKLVERKIVKNDSPLTNNLVLLFAGPDQSEKKKGYQSLIPEGTKLKGISIKDGVATLNLSEEFEYNMYGAEGQQNSLAQIVYTATEFSTVKSVRFLIEGEKKDYLGSEGVWIGSALSRGSF